MTGVTVVMPYHRNDKRVVQNLQRLTEVRHIREVLLVNDGCSWEPTEEIQALLHADSSSEMEIRLLRNERGKGVSGARNTGILHATQPLICFLDYDDIMLMHRFDRDMEHFSDPSCYATACEYDTCQESDSGYIETWTVPYLPSVFTGGQDFFCNDYLGLPHLTCFTYRRSRLLESGIFFDEDLKGSEDSLFKYRCVEEMGFRTSPGSMSVRIMRHAHNTTSDVYSTHLLENRLIFFWRFSSIFVKYPLALGHFKKSYLKTLRRYIQKKGNPMIILRHIYGNALIRMGLPAGSIGFR